MNEMKLEKKHAHKLPMGILGGSLSPNGEQIVAACMDGVYTTLLEKRQPQRLYAHDSYVSSARWLQDDVVLSAGYDGVLKWFDLRTGETLRSEKLHDFWSWDLDVSADEQQIASVTGQYLAGGYKYEPQPEREPSIRVVSATDGETLHALPHVPSVQAVAFSPDGNYVAAGNLMGEVRVYDTRGGELANQFTTPDFTSWGIIKSHCYLGGIFALRFTPDGDELLLAGMGPMRDPMAGNGKQLWQRWRWKQTSPEMVDQTHDGENGEGLMETLAVHPSAECFVMGGRLRGGDWNVAVFSLADGKRMAKLKTGFRVTEALFTPDGSKLVLLGANGQPGNKKDGKFPDFGRIEVYEIS
jgi:WD40 repeat protein